MRRKLVIPAERPGSAQAARESDKDRYGVSEFWVPDISLREIPG
jgi:hypothetical protein